MSTFLVTTRRNAGAGSLRQAIVASNQQPGADAIEFGVAGTIRMGRTSLPSITDRVRIDGSTAPGFAGAPVVTVDFRGSKGLRFEQGADGSVLRSLALVRAGNAGVTLSASRVTVQGNYIGLRSDGKTVAGNQGDGVRINASSHGNLIGQVDPVSGVTYYNADSVSVQPVSGWQGIRNSSTPGQYLITGTSNTNGLLYIGPISGAGGTSYSVNYPGAYSTSVYGPDILGGDVLRLVGSYRATSGGNVQGFVYQGTTADLANPDDYKTIDYPGVTYVYVHSTMGDLAVGNAGDIPRPTDHAFLYSVSQGRILTDIVYPGSQTSSTSAYGIWSNGGTSYTICGGYSKLGSAGKTLAAGYLVDYDSVTGQFSHWTSFDGPDGLVGRSPATHFQGISSPQPGVYTLAAAEVAPGSSTVLQAAVATVRRNPDGTFGPTAWLNLNYPGAVDMQTSDSVAGNQVVGIVALSSGIQSYQATVNLEAQLSNVISGNGGNGIGIHGSNNNRIAMNNIGTDATGILPRGNGRNGIFLTRRAAGNLIGGTVSGGNDPTGNVFVRPPQGNLISGNRANGVLIKGGATRNTMSGNFVGTDATGNSALGNSQDGVAIVGANGNQLIGCTLQDQPFVYYNVLSGNGGNGLRITNSNDITVHANFLGVGANNATITPNGGDGLLVSGSSKNTQVGGVIPLGNVISGNDRNGIEVRDTASGFTSFNTFNGIFAFAGAAPNRRDGTLITSRGGNILIRTCIVSGNLRDGIELGGSATGVQVTETAVGTDTAIQTAIPNRGSGIKISGHAHNNAIGGFQPSVQPHVTISANRRYGIEIVGSARDNVVFHSVIGSDAEALADLGNGLGGIYLGPGTSSNRIGGEAAPARNKILYSRGPGVLIRSSRAATVMGNEIQKSTDLGVTAGTRRTNLAGPAAAGNGQQGIYITGLVTGTRIQSNAIRGNSGDGVVLVKARRLTIGGSSAGTGNGIVGNHGYGLYAFGLCSGSVVQDNVIVANARGTVNLSKSRGITYIPK